VLTVANGMSDGEARALFGKYQNYQVLEFTSMSKKVFRGFDLPEDTRRFHEKLKTYTGIWCCIHAHPGHIWYDMWFDEIPHTDRHNRKITEKWEPKPGP